MGGANHTRVWVRPPGAGRDGVMDVGVCSGAASCGDGPQGRLRAPGRTNERCGLWVRWAAVIGLLTHRGDVCPSAGAGTPALFPRGEAEELQEWHCRQETGQGEPPPEGCGLLGDSGAETWRRRAGAVAIVNDEWASRGSSVCHLSHAVCTPTRPRCFSIIVSVRDPCPEVNRWEIEDRGIDS